MVETSGFIIFKLRKNSTRCDVLDAFINELCRLLNICEHIVLVSVSYLIVLDVKSFFQALYLTFLISGANFRCHLSMT